MTNNKIASLDLGSNSFRFLIADNINGKMKNKKVFQEIPRLSEDLNEGANFSYIALNRAWETLNKFQKIVLEENITKVLACGTMAFRIANNGPALLKELENKFNWHTKILTGEEEAFYNAYGVNLTLKENSFNNILFDIGGRSTEFVLLKNNKIKKQVSLNIGVVKLNSSFLKSDPPKDEEIYCLIKYLSNLLKDNLNKMLCDDFQLVGNAGTVTAIAALLLNLKTYQAELINNAVIKKEEIIKLFNILKHETIFVRNKRLFLEKGRGDVIIAGLVLVLEILNFFNKDEMIISDSGLLEALWFKAAGII